MSGYLDGRVAVGYDLGAVCNKQPMEAVLPYVVRAHDDMGYDDFTDLSELKNTIDKEYKQGEMSYGEARELIHREVGEILKWKPVEKTERITEQILGLSEPETHMIEKTRRKFWKWMYESRETPLVDPEVRTGFQMLEDEGVNMLEVTDELGFVAEPVTRGLLGLEDPEIVSAEYPTEEDKFVGNDPRVEDKGEVFSAYLEELKPELSIAIIDSPRDLPMGEAADKTYVVDPDEPLSDSISEWTLQAQNRVFTDNPVTTFDQIYRDIVEHERAAGNPETVQKAHV